MPKRSIYNKQGALIMGAAGYHRGIFGVPELAKVTGIPYQTLHKRLCVDFGRATGDEIKAMFRGAGMTGEEIAEVWK